MGEGAEAGHDRRPGIHEILVDFSFQDLVSGLGDGHFLRRRGLVKILHEL